MKEGLVRRGLLLLLLVFSFQTMGAVDPSVQAVYQEAASSWLKKMSVAFKRLSYRGVIVYQEGASLVTLAVTRDAMADRDRERVVYRDGVFREMVRNDHGLFYSGSEEGEIHFNRRSSLVPMVGKFFDGFSERYYDVRYGSKQLDQIAGRESVMLDLIPADAYRYGFWLWLDTQSGLLLKSVMLDKDNRIIERLQFTDIEVSIKLTADELAAMGKRKISNGKEIDLQVSPDQKLAWGWEANWLPDGFTLKNVTQRVSPVSQYKTDAVNYSDGVASFSVFVEPADTRVFSQVSERIGAMSAVVKVFRRGEKYFHVTVIGEVPLATAEGVAASIGPAKGQ